MNKINGNTILFFTVLTGVWLILLAFCALIGILIVPIEISQQNLFLSILISAGKVIISLIFIIVWLVGWYKTMNFLLHFEFYMSDINSYHSKDN